MEFMTAAILSGVAYDAIKRGVIITAQKIKTELKDWLIEDDIATAVSAELNKLDLSDELSEKAIERRIIESTELSGLIKNIFPVIEGNVIQQCHYGSGDNVGRDKIVNK